MNKNQFFDLNRFGLYIKSNLLINYKKILLSIIAITLIIYGILFLNMPKGDNMGTFKEQGYLGTFVFFVFALIFYMGSGFRAFNNKTTTRHFLATPVSTFEKYTAEFLFQIVGSIVALLIIFWISAHLARWTALLTLITPGSHSAQIATFNYGDLWKEINSTDNMGLKVILAILISCLSIFTVRIFFTKNGLIKSILTLFVLSGLFFGFKSLLVKLFFNGLFLFNDIHLDLSKDFSVYKLLVILAYIIGFTGLILIGYYKLKEKEL
ncbi:MAG: hypothetical protein ACYC2P_03775 [Paludibacteraceae bacterium]